VKHWPASTQGGHVVAQTRVELQMCFIYSICSFFACLLASSRQMDKMSLVTCNHVLRIRNQEFVSPWRAKTAGVGRQSPLPRFSISTATIITVLLFFNKKEATCVGIK
jgi:hypothetical protein